MKSDDYRRILDFFFSGAEVSEEMKLMYLGWLGVHGDEPEVKKLLEEYWNSTSSSSPEYDLTAGLDKLMASLQRDPGNGCGEAGTAGMPGDRPGRKDGEYNGLPPRVHPGFSSGELPRGTAPSGRALSRKVLRCCAAAVASVAIFLGGAAVSRLGVVPEKETVLVASSDTPGSYILPDGSKVWLNRDSRLTYNQDFGKRERNVTIDGEGYFEVTRNESSPFVVNMHDNLRVKVLGTTFNVLSDLNDHSAEVILRSGSVQVSDFESNELVILKPDQKYSWDGGRTEVTAVNAADCCRWYERRLAFDNVRLGDILESLSHKYQIKVESNVGYLNDKRMSLTVKDESVEEVLEVLSSLLPVRWERQGKTIIIDNKTKQI